MANATSTAFLESLPVGVRFTPTDEELVNYYLKQKMMGNDHLDSIIPEVNIYKFEPWDLPQKSKIKSDDMEWYFFCPRVPKYAKSKRVNRTTVAGYWKVTGNGRKVWGKGNKKLIAKTNILVFHLGRFRNGIKTSWVMHEFLPSFNLPQQKDFVICRVTKNMDKMPTVEAGESSPVISSDSENQIPYESPGTAMSEEGESESNAIIMASDFGNQNATEVNYTPTIEEALDPIMASDFGNQNVTEVNYTPTTEGASDPLMASDHPFDLPEEMRTYLESFSGFDENDFNLNSALYSTTSANMH